jgi:hypothetical protein
MASFIMIVTWSRSGIVSPHRCLCDVLAAVCVSAAVTRLTSLILDLICTIVNALNLEQRYRINKIRSYVVILQAQSASEPAESERSLSFQDEIKMKFNPTHVSVVLFSLQRLVLLMQI